MEQHALTEKEVSEMNAVGIFLSIHCVKACSPWHRTVSLAATLVLSIGLARTASTVNTKPYDYQPLPLDSNLPLQYYQYNYSEQRNLNADRILHVNGSVGGHFESEVVSLRYLHYMKLFGIEVTPDIIVPIGSVIKVQVEGEKLNPSNGFGD